MTKILLIEDNQDVRENTAELLELSNYEVVTAENGKIGIEKALKLNPDIVVCDIMMPVMDGYEVLDILSKNLKTASVPFIFLTAKTDKLDIRKGMNLGADDYLTKPFNEEELINAIESRLKKYQFYRKEFSKSATGINEFVADASKFMNLADLIGKCEVKMYSKKEIIYREGSPAHTLYLIQSGIVKTYKNTSSGKELVTGFYGKGEFIGLISLLSDKRTYGETATAMRKVEVCTILKEDFLTLLHANELVANKFIQIISNNLANTQEQLVRMAYGTVRQRVAKTLLDLYDEGAVIDSINKGISIPREDFASMIGIATETAIRMLSVFKDEGLIRIEPNRMIILLDQDELKYITTAD